MLCFQQFLFSKHCFPSSFVLQFLIMFSIAYYSESASEQAQSVVVVVVVFLILTVRVAHRDDLSYVPVQSRHCLNLYIVSFFSNHKNCSANVDIVAC